MTPQELKNSIFQLAIQGKLVEQRPEEGTAEVLYRQIQQEKQTLIKAGKIKKEDCVAVIADQPQETNIEVKTIWNYLFRTNDNEEPSGTLPFELWSSSQRNHPGWFIKIQHPEDYTNVVCPDIIIFLLVAYEDVFASIAFQDVPALIDRLRNLALEYHIDLDNLPIGTTAKEWSPESIDDEETAIISENNWLVPFALIEDLAVVTMIGTQPRLRPSIVSGVGGARRCSSFTQESRYRRLKNAPNGNDPKSLPENKAGRFIGNSADQTFAAIDYDLRILDYERFPNYCPSLSKRKGILESLRFILMNMLAHDKSTFCHYLATREQ